MRAPFLAVLWALVFDTALAATASATAEVADKDIMPGLISKENVNTYQVAEIHIVNNNTAVYHPDTDNDDIDAQLTMSCKPKDGVTRFPSIHNAYSKKYFACCPLDRHLTSATNRIFDCCADGHTLVGSPEERYHCCPTGQEYVGGKCVDPCPDGKERDKITKKCPCPEGMETDADGDCVPPQDCPDGKQRDKITKKCVCPEGMEEDKDGDCVPPQDCPDGKERDKVTKECVCPSPMIEAEDGSCEPPRLCDSGLRTGKCYTLSLENGQRLSADDSDAFLFSLPSAKRRLGRFQLCADESCVAGKQINPKDRVYIRETFSYNPPAWLNDATNGNHIKAKGSFQEAGAFTLTKWSWGFYCLGGFDAGIGPACPSDSPALTFLPGKPELCFSVILEEVPCETKNDSNNCAWLESQAAAGKMASNEL